MESRAKYILVGVVVTFLVVSAVLFVLWISDLGVEQNVRYYTVYFRQQGLSGLQVDSAVTMKGIQVGKVTQFAISDNDVESVKVTLRIEGQTPIKVDTRAVIRRNLLTGLANIELVDTTNQSEPLVEVLAHETYPIIPEGTTKLDQLASSLPAVIDDLGEITRKVKKLASDENIENISQTIANAQKISGAVASQSKNLEETLSDIHKMSSDARGLIESMQKATNDTDQRFASVSQELIKALNQINSTAGTLEVQVRDLSGAMSGSVTKASMDFSNLSRELQNAAQAFSAAMTELENPRGIITGPPAGALGPGEKLSGTSSAR